MGRARKVVNKRQKWSKERGSWLEEEPGAGGGEGAREDEGKGEEGI